jgi:hypothetical protein
MDESKIDPNSPYKFEEEYKVLPGEVFPAPQLFDQIVIGFAPYPTSKPY